MREVNVAEVPGKGMAHREIAAVLGLMYTAPDRFTSVSVELREWSDLGVLAQAQQAWLKQERSRGSTIASIEGRSPNGFPLGLVSNTAQYHYVKHNSRELGCSWLQVGVSNDGAQIPGTGTLWIEEMLQPISLLSDATFSIVGTGIIAGRRTIEISAAPRRQWHEHTEGRLWEGTDEFRLLVDLERGILLGATALFRDQAIAGKKVVNINFGEPLPPDNVRWDGISEVVGLLYSAQHNFITVRATVREWRGDHQSRHRLAAVNPSRLRKESIGPDGRRLGLKVYDGGVWWRYSASARAAETNAPMPSLPPEYNARFRPHPFTPGDDVYQVLDGEYAIIAEPWLNPSHLLYCWWLEPTGRTVFAGREAIRVRGEANGNNGPRYWWEKINECELLVDSERGTLLRLAGIVDGQEVAGHEVTAIEFDGPVDPAEFKFTPPDGAAVSVAWWSDKPLPPPPSFRLG